MSDITQNIGSPIRDIGTPTYSFGCDERILLESIYTAGLYSAKNKGRINLLLS